jgi:membrane protease YdiL (CAAX protease family)
VTVTALVAAVVILVATNLLNNRLAARAYVLTCLGTAALLLALARAAGLSWADVGLGVDSLGRGVGWGLVLVAAVAVVYLVVALLPATRRVFVDRRVEHAAPGEVRYEIAVRIPFGTVALEEIAFRGVLYGLAAHLYGTLWATVISSLLFGLWHIVPARELVELNRAARAIFALHRALMIPAAVVATFMAGLVLCELRRRTGNLVPVLCAHWATNALGYLAAYLVTTRSTAPLRREPDRGRSRTT